MKINKKLHTYTHAGEKYDSVTTIIGRQFPKFDEKAVARKLAKFPINKQRKHGVRYWLNQWKLQRDYGSNIHWLIEDFIKNNTPIDRTLGKDEYTTACDWINNEFQKYNTPIMHSEMLVFNTDLKIAGTIDLLVEYTQGSDRLYDIIDWKITKEITKENKYDKELAKCGLPNANYWKYALQLNLYAYILHLSDKKINKLKLCHLIKDKIIVYEIPCMFDKIGEFI
jgi:ATP-dependent exoDNAse (exonuclease V) beta subunit